MKSLTRILSVVAVSLALLALPIEANSQFLKKLSKGLEKVNKTLEDVNKTLDGKSTTTTKQSTQNTGSKKSNEVKQSTTADAPIQNQNSEINQSLLDKVAIDTKEPIRPHVTANTRFLLLSGKEYPGDVKTIVSDVNEGWFAIKNMRGQWSFYNAENGQCLFRNIGTGLGSGHDDPHFNNGVALVKEYQGKGYKILYSDGQVRPLDGSYVGIQNFVDGVSMAKTFDAAYNSTAFYIDANANKIYPALNRSAKMGRMLSTHKVRPLNDGLRAVYKDSKWGFVNGKGVMTIAPKFRWVRDFSEGFAWATIEVNGEYKIGLINKTGGWAIQPRYRGYDMDYIEDDFGDASCGILRVRERDDLVYYDTTGKELLRLTGAKGTGFTSGYAFVTIENEESYIINTDMEVERVIDDSTGEWNISDNTPAFPNYPLAIINNQETAVTPKGDAIIAYNPSYDLYLRPFSSDGYAYAETRFEGGTVKGFINTSGEYTVVMSLDSQDKFNWIDLQPVDPPFINDPRPGDSIPDIPRDTIGPRELPATLYAVTTKVEPAEGGVISPGAKLRYGKTYTAQVTPNEGWKLASITSTSKRGKTAESNEFTVYEDMTITANFVEKDVVSTTPTGAWQGKYDLVYTTPDKETIREQIPIYLELSDTKSVSTPMGNKYGILTFVFDPERIYRTGEKRNTSGGIQRNIMHIPFTVEGQIERNGRKYLLIEGGELKLGNVMVEDGLKDGGVNALVVNIMLRLFGSNLNLDSASYMVAYEKTDEGIKLGSMSRFHEDYGWLTAGDERFRELKTSGIMWSYNTGYPSNMFEGSVLKPAERRSDITWYAPLSWVFNDGLLHQQLKDAFDKAYRKYISEYTKFWRE